MVVSNVREGHRGAWRSLSGDVVEPVAERKQKNSCSHSLSSLYTIELCRTLQNFAELCRTLHFVEAQIFDFVNLHTKTVNSEQ